MFPESLLLLRWVPFCASLQWLVLRTKPLSETKAELRHRGPALRADWGSVWPGIQGLRPGRCLAHICQVTLKNRLVAKTVDRDVFEVLKVAPRLLQAVGSVNYIKLGQRPDADGVTDFVTHDTSWRLQPETLLFSWAVNESVEMHMQNPRFPKYVKELGGGLRRGQWAFSWLCSCWCAGCGDGRCSLAAQGFLAKLQELHFLPVWLVLCTPPRGELGGHRLRR